MRYTTGSTKPRVKVPSWLLDSIEDHVDRVTIKRSEPRQSLLGRAQVRFENAPSRAISVRLLNICSDGISFLSREPISPRNLLRLAPEEGPNPYDAGNQLRIRVVHCTQAVNGFKIGCEFLPNV